MKKIFCIIVLFTLFLPTVSQTLSQSVDFQLPVIGIYDFDAGDYDYEEKKGKSYNLRFNFMSDKKDKSKPLVHVSLIEKNRKTGNSKLLAKSTFDGYDSFMSEGKDFEDDDYIILDNGDIRMTKYNREIKFQGIDNHGNEYRYHVDKDIYEGMKAEVDKVYHDKFESLRNKLYWSIPYEVRRSKHTFSLIPLTQSENSLINCQYNIVEDNLIYILGSNSKVFTALNKLLGSNKLRNNLTDICNFSLRNGKKFDAKVLMAKIPSPDGILMCIRSFDNKNMEELKNQLKQHDIIKLEIKGIIIPINQPTHIYTRKVINSADELEK